MYQCSNTSLTAYKEEQLLRERERGSRLRGPTQERNKVLMNSLAKNLANVLGRMPDLIKISAEPHSILDLLKLWILADHCMP